MPQAARVADSTGHGTPLSPGPGSSTVMIGNMPAWRAVPSALGAAIEAVSNQMKSFMSTPVMTPADAGPKIAQIMQGLAESGGKAAQGGPDVAGAPGAAAAAGSAAGTVAGANTGLTTAWTTASAAPGGQPAANQAYTEGIKAAVAAAASSVFSAMGSAFDMHVCPMPCPVPPHGPGVVTKGSQTVVVEHLSLARQGDKVFEACGGEDPIVMGCATVDVG